MPDLVWFDMSDVAGELEIVFELARILFLARLTSFATGCFTVLDAKLCTDSTRPKIRQKKRGKLCICMYSASCIQINMK